MRIRNHQQPRDDVWTPRHVQRCTPNFFAASPGFFAGGGADDDVSLGWDPALLAPGLSLSSSGRIATPVSGSGTRAVLGNVDRATGKHYFEIKTEIGSSTGIYCGVAPEGISLTTQPIFNAMGVPYFALRSNGQNGSDLGTGAGIGLSLAAGENVIGLAVDVDARTVAIYTANVLRATRSFGTGGAVRPYGAASSTGPTLALTLRMYTADQTYAPPAGFTAWANA